MFLLSVTLLLSWYTYLSLMNLQMKTHVHVSGINKWNCTIWCRALSFFPAWLLYRLTSAPFWLLGKHHRLHIKFWDIWKHVLFLASDILYYMILSLLGTLLESSLLLLAWACILTFVPTKTKRNNWLISPLLRYDFSSSEISLIRHKINLVCAVQCTI